jgi:signal transduction histidine kinase
VVVHAVAYTDTVVANTTYLGVLVGASVAAWIGAERAPRARHLVPRLVAVGISLTALGDVLWFVLDEAGASTDVSIADPPWFASYVVLCAALWVVLDRSRGGGQAYVDFVIDALTIVVVSGLIVWSTSVSSIVADDSVAPFVRTVWAAYPIADAVLLALVVRVLMSPSARVAIDASFAVGAFLWLAADLAYLQAPQGVGMQVTMDAAWMIAPALMARAAWRVREVEPRAADSPGFSSRVAQLLVAVGSLFVPVAIELANDLRGDPSQPLLLFTGTAALIALAAVRTGRLISSEASARRALEQARDAALEASRAKSMFLANMSHEIRTPLTTVLAAEEMLEDTTLSDLQLRLVGKMHRSGELLKALVERILDFSRLEAGQLTLASTPVDLHGMVDDIADIYEPRAIQGGIRFTWQLDPRVPQHVVSDPARLMQILTNLLDNAMKFTHEGTVSLVVRPARPDGDERDGTATEAVVEFVVEDDGIGIPATCQESVFDSFTQVDGSTTRAYGGSGLGLAICRELAQLMGGSITLESQPDVGSRFVVRLPLAPVVGECLGATSTVNPSRSAKADPSPDTQVVGLKAFG